MEANRAGLAPLTSAQKAELKLNDYESGKFHSGVGAGLKIGWNENFVISVDFGTALNKQDGNFRILYRFELLVLAMSGFIVFSSAIILFLYVALVIVFITGWCAHLIFRLKNTKPQNKTYRLL